MNKYFSSFKDSQKYYLFIVCWTIILFLVVYLYLSSNPSIAIYTLFIICYLIVLFYLFGQIRKKELGEIQSIITSIRLNKFKTKDSIKLNADLNKLEDEICAMYDKMHSDISSLKKLEKMRTQFLANVSHELRTPIFKVQGYIETLLDGAVNDREVRMKFLHKAKNSTIHLGNLLNDLIDISMIESGEMRMSFRYFKLNEYILDIINHFKESVSEKNLKIIYNPCNDDLKIYGDKDRLKVVFNNLIQNAIKYTDKGEIEIKIEEKDESVLIQIRDTGIGIDPSEINRIFERFYRTELAQSRLASGTGLGLAIVKHIVEAHNSNISIVSELEKGSEFSFELSKL